MATRATPSEVILVRTQAVNLFEDEQLGSPHAEISFWGREFDSKGQRVDAALGTLGVRPSSVVSVVSRLERGLDLIGIEVDHGEGDSRGRTTSSYNLDTNGGSTHRTYTAEGLRLLAAELSTGVERRPEEYAAHFGLNEARPTIAGPELDALRVLVGAMPAILASRGSDRGPA